MTIGCRQWVQEGTGLGKCRNEEAVIDAVLTERRRGKATDHKGKT